MTSEAAPLEETNPPPQLPPELLVEIFSYLPQIHSPAYPRTASARATLAALCRTSSTFQSIAQPILWRSIDVRTRDDAADLVETLERSPERAGGIRQVRLITEQLIGWPKKNETTELVGKLKKVRVMIVEQRWFGLELLQSLPELTRLHLLGPWSPSLTPRSTIFLPLHHLRILAITFHGLCDLLHPDYDAHRSLVALVNVATLSLHPAKVNISSWLPPRPPPSQNLFSSFPNLSLISTPLSFAFELTHLIPPTVHDIDTTAVTTKRKSLLWRVTWQAFVDFMPPWRSFTIEEDVPPVTVQSLPLHAVIRHIAIAPFPYSPIPDHFLLELLSRLRKDQSIRYLETLWLDAGWKNIGTAEMRREWEELLSEKGVLVEYVAMKGEGLEGWESRVEEEFSKRMSVAQPGGD